MPDLLIELFSEEIPARMQAKAAADLQKLVTDGLVEAGLTYASAAAFHTPRRLALTVGGLTAESPTLQEERRGPKVGAPDKALEGFMRGAGVTREQLEEREEKKGSFYFATVTTPGRKADAIIADVLEKTVRGFPWPKSMRWGSGTLRWVRPLHRITCILTTEEGAQVVDLDIDGIKAGNTTEGHRFMGGKPFDVTSFDDYDAKLKQAKVILQASEREQHIWNDATNMAFAQGLEVVEDNGLLAEVAGLVEWPVVLMGDIAEDFLGLPPEVLQTSMKEHQKFFSVKNPETGRIEKFVTVANIETSDNGATILAGNQKVLAARLSDAKFFWENDLRVATTDGLTAWTDRLSNVTFHNKLGSQQGRIQRIAALAEALAPQVGSDAALARQAAEVAKADLSSEMVYEFPELQGLMGRYYAEAAGLPPEVANACETHYSPLGPSDDVPSEPVAVTVALADKLDTLTGFWAIDEKPTGSKDPFALRRAALGVIRLVLVNDLRMSLKDAFSSQLSKLAAELNWQTYIKQADEIREKGRALGFDGGEIEKAAAKLATEAAEHGLIVSNYEPIATDDGRQLISRDGFDEAALTSELLSFFHDRLKVHLRAEGIRHDVIDACLAMDGADDLVLLVKRAEALQELLSSEDGENLVQGFKRANNILSQAEEKDGVEYSFGADVKYAETDAEKALFEALDAAEEKITPAMQSEDFAAAMEAMAALRAPIDTFFDAVQVNSDNSIIRRNRLNLLSRIRTICLQVADLTRLDG
ncbi:glycyl-tRNA synthetase beta chain [Sagittula marina]|uniref:Glycine--tRNA ligase beta subunit n=1 Tax=Sagittula marina TaxID=943940 RepID=A0A7W6DMU6_9RHOB|nr:glycine--tRNA ligase subunit beta [Sagittula marina]MBB3985642.1 glycyl-tRNA synthetase beta chain [Sagittula marina]